MNTFKPPKNIRGEQYTYILMALKLLTMQLKALKSKEVVIKTIIVGSEYDHMLYRKFVLYSEKDKDYSLLVENKQESTMHGKTVKRSFKIYETKDEEPLITEMHIGYKNYSHYYPKDLRY